MQTENTHLSQSFGHTEITDSLSSYSLTLGVKDVHFHHRLLSLGLIAEVVVTTTGVPVVVHAVVDERHLAAFKRHQLKKICIS
jgi:hypothetical protein